MTDFFTSREAARRYDLFRPKVHQDRYLARFPSPPRNRMASVVPRDDPEITCLGEDRGSLLIDFTPEQLVGYLSTQSNVERAVHDGADYDRICADLLAEIGALDSGGPFRYAFSFEIHQFSRNPPASEFPE